MISETHSTPARAQLAHREEPQEPQDAGRLPCRQLQEDYEKKRIEQVGPCGWALR